MKRAYLGSLRVFGPPDSIVIGIGQFRLSAGEVAISKPPIVIESVSFTLSTSNVEVDPPVVVVVESVSFDLTASNVSFGDEGDEYFADVVLLCHMNGVDNSQTFVDSSLSGHTLTAVNNAMLDDGQSVFGGIAAYFDGTNDGIEAADSADWRLFNSTSDEFTVEAWVRPTTLNSSGRLVCGKASTSNGSLLSWFLMLEQDGSVRFAYHVDSTTYKEVVSSTGVIEAATWHNVAVDKDDEGVFRIYVDGVMVGTGSPSPQTLQNPSNVFRIGLSSNNQGDMSGYIDELRITKGVARYKSDGGFTVRNLPFPDS